LTKQAVLSTQPKQPQQALEASFAKRQVSNGKKVVSFNESQNNSFFNADDVRRQDSLESVGTPKRPVVMKQGTVMKAMEEGIEQI